MITPVTFAEKFGKDIRVGFNWDRFVKEGWHIESVKLTDRDALRHCFMPWYIGKMGEEVAYDDPDAVPMCLIDVPKATHVLNDERQTDIHDYVRKFKTEGAPVEFSVPTYGLPEDKHFVLDRNHRLAAISLSSVPFSVTLWNVRGPHERECLLDLIHWLPKPKKETEPGVTNAG